MKLQYIGTNTYQEHPLTKHFALWQPQQVSEITDSTRLSELLKITEFKQYDLDNIEKNIYSHLLLSSNESLYSSVNFESIIYVSNSIVAKIKDTGSFSAYIRNDSTLTKIEA